MVLGYRIEKGRPSPGVGELERQLVRWREVFVRPLEQAGIKVFAVPGNHEISSREAPARLEAYRRIIGEPQYSFDFEGAHFTCLNTDQPRKPKTADLAWLGKDLAQARGKWDHLFVMGHEPAWPILGERRGLVNGKELWAMLSREGADAYICGHEHVYARTRRDGVHQVTTGGAGAITYPFLIIPPGFATAYSGHHLTLWTVDGPKVAVKALALKDWREIDSFSYSKEARWKRRAPVRQAPASGQIKGPHLGR